MHTDAVYRVFSMEGDGEHFRGTAFAIARNAFLTCAHLFPNPPDLGRVFLRGPGRHGDIGQVDWHVHHALDLACATLKPGIGEVDSHLPILLRDVTRDLGELTCLGYFDRKSGLQAWSDKVSGASLADGWVALGNTVADGVSGGPVLCGERVIAVVRADNQRTNQTYVLPLLSAWSWLEALQVPINHGPGKMALAQVPIRPPVRAAEIPDLVIRTFAERFPEHRRAATFVERAMDERRRANPEGFTDDQILIHRSDLHFSSAIPSTVWWSEALLAAASKSRRTLAAIFLAEGAPNPELMPESDGRQYQEFVDNLIHPTPPKRN